MVDVGEISQRLASGWYGHQEEADHARNIPATRQRWIFALQNTTSTSGTSTVEMPVRNADFEGVVSRSPAVWKAYPRPRNNPTSAPVKKPARVRLLQFFPVIDGQQHRSQ